MKLKMRRSLKNRPLNKEIIGEYKFFYDYSYMMLSANPSKLRKFISSYFKNFSTIAKDWNDSLNTEWFCRSYFAAKLILNASMTLASLNYAEVVNLQITVPYLQYYSVLNSLRALLLMLPNQEWKEGSLIDSTHSKIIKATCSELSKLDISWLPSKDTDNNETYYRNILQLKANREVISYNAPSCGLGVINNKIRHLEICQFSVEVAQLISEILEKSLSKHMNKEYTPSLLNDELEILYRTKKESYDFKDNEDWYRSDYFRRKNPRPINLQFMIREGHVEDFFGAWCNDFESDDSFNPDEDWRILFDFC